MTMVEEAGELSPPHPASMQHGCEHRLNSHQMLSLGLYYFRSNAVSWPALRDIQRTLILCSCSGGAGVIEGMDRKDTDKLATPWDDCWWNMLFHCSKENFNITGKDETHKGNHTKKKETKEDKERCFTCWWFIQRQKKMKEYPQPFGSPNTTHINLLLW